MNQKEYNLHEIAYFVPTLSRFSVDRNKFWEWWQEVNIPIKRLAKDSRGNGGGYDGEFWDGVTIWQSNDYQKNIVWKVNYHENQDLFGNLLDQIRTNLPWYDLKGITLWSNKSSVGSHQDGLPRDAFPSAPRIMLFDECEHRTFYLLHQKPFFMCYPDLCQGPNLFYFNNQNFMHGTAAPKGGRKILVRIDGPLIDTNGFIEYMKAQLNNGARYEFIKETIKHGPQ